MKLTFRHEKSWRNTQKLLTPRKIELINNLCNLGKTNDMSKEEFQPLDKFEVVSFNGDSLGRELNLNSNGFSAVKLTAIEFITATTRKVNVSELTKNKLFGEGIECLALKYKADGWQSGKIRVKLTVEFCPDEPEIEETPAPNTAESDEPESTLDEIRQMIKEENQ